MSPVVSKLAAPTLFETDGPVGADRLAASVPNDAILGLVEL